MKISRIFNTLKYLKPIQFFYRFRNKFISNKKRVYSNVAHKNINLFIDGIHNDESYLERFKAIANSVEILNQTVELDYKNNNGISPLVRFNLEYFEYAIVWAQKGIPFKHLKNKWNEYIESNSKLYSYIISLQIPNMIIAMGIYEVDDQEIYDELYSRYKWLIKHQEKHLLANHYFENLKAIVISSYVFNEENIFKKYIWKLEKECREEILDDGIHFELSFMYHKLVLEDLLLIRKLCNRPWLDQYIQKMLNAIISIENGFNRTPLFNDSGDNVAKSAEALKKGCEKEFDIKVTDNIDSFVHSGYNKIREGNLAIIIDSGSVGPSYNPGHGHCDCLSFELFKDNKPVFVNSGTYQYQGDKRSYFRSSQAHNITILNNHEQSDCWGEHRVGKRIKKVSGKLVGQSFFGSFINQYGEKCERNIILRSGVITILDSFPKEKPGLDIISYLHLAPGYNFQNGLITGYGSEYKIETINCKIEQIDSIYSSEFGKTENNKCLLFKWKTDSEEHGYSINLNS